MKPTIKLLAVIIAICLIGCKFKSTEQLRPELKKTQYRLYVATNFYSFKNPDSIRFNQVIVDSTSYSRPFTRVEDNRLYIGDFHKKENSKIYLFINNRDTTLIINTYSVDSLNITRW